jgi:hypothetical protein
MDGRIAAIPKPGVPPACWMLDSSKMYGEGARRQPHNPTAPFDLREGVEEVRRVHHLLARKVLARLSPRTEGTRPCRTSSALDEG